MIDPIGIQEMNAYRPRTVQKIGALIGGGALAVFGLTRRSTMGYALAGAGGVLAYFGATANGAPREFLAETTILLNSTPEETYRFWRDFENLPRFMRHLESVRTSDDRRSHWIARGPAGTRIEWDTEIVQEVENSSIHWRSLPGSDLVVNGSVQFHRAPGNRGTEFTATIYYQPPAGKAGKILAKLLGRDPHLMIKQDLRRFKALIETGEIPTTDGQSHGPRDIMTGIMRMADPDSPVKREAGIVQQFKQRRRMA